MQRYGITGDCWHMTWGRDDRQYVSLCDGYGNSQSPEGMYNSRLLAINGEARVARFDDVPGYPKLLRAYGNVPRYYNFGTLALDGSIYQFLSTPNHEFTKPDARFIGAKLIFSSDGGLTWRNQDSSTPVVWDEWDRRSRDTLVFFEEDQEAFSLLTVLQMGRDYGLNRDGYVYVYAPNGNTEGTMNELVMFRVPKGKILRRDAYEYFSGPGSNGAAKWTADITGRAVVHAFPRGWVNRLMHPYAWHPSVVYNGPLGVYMMTAWGMGVAPDGLWFDKPSYLGLWIARNPWGPWTQVHEETAWMPEGDAAARAFQPQIAPKWIAPDGRSFWLVWSDYQQKEREVWERFTARVDGKWSQGRMSREDWSQAAEMMRKHMPYYAFNVQRVDLTVA